MVPEWLTQLPVLAARTVVDVQSHGTAQMGMLDGLRYPLRSLYPSHRNNLRHSPRKISMMQNSCFDYANEKECRQHYEIGVGDRIGSLLGRQAESLQGLPAESCEYCVSCDRHPKDAACVLFVHDHS